MPDETRKAKLTANQRREVLSHLALGFGPTYISDHIFDTYGIKISPACISGYYKHSKAFKKHIKRYRALLHEKVADIPIATKAGRLKMLQKAYNEAMTWRTDKLYFDKDGGFNGKVEKRMIGIIASLVNEARVEMGGADSTEKQGFDTYFIELIRKHNEELKKEGIDGFRITKFENRALDRFISK